MGGHQRLSQARDRAGSARPSLIRLMNARLESMNPRPVLLNFRRELMDSRSELMSARPKEAAR